MKRCIFIIAVILFAYSLNAQVKQEVIASAGGYSVNGNLSLSWTLGETIIPTFTNGNLALTHGFQQQLIVTAVEENLENSAKVNIYPNPVSDWLSISFEEPLDGEVKVFILDTKGSLVKTDFMEPAEVEKQFNLQDLPAGLYFLKLTKGKLSNVYKVVKL